MADNDSFVQEVTEEVRRDAMFAAWKKYGPFLIGGLILVIAGTAGSAWWRNQQASAMQERGGVFLEAQSMEDQSAAAEAFKTLAAESDGDFAAMAGLRAAAALGGQGDVEGAIAEYEAVAAMADVDPRLSELAKLRLVMIQADTMDPDAMLDALGPLAQADAPWRNPALEFSAAAYVRKGDNEAAIETLRLMIGEGFVSPATNQRIQEMIAALGGKPLEDDANGGESQ